MYDNGLCGSHQQQSSANNHLPIGEIPLVEVTKDDGDLSLARAEELNSSLAESTLPKGFRFEDCWLVYQAEPNDDKTPQTTKICSELIVVARSRNPEGENHGRLLEFKDPDNVLHKWAMPMALLAGDGTAYRQELLSKGLIICPGKLAKYYLTLYIQTSNPVKTVRCVEQTGWNKDCTAFVFRDKTLGDSGREPLILQTTACLPTTHSISGSLKEWQQIPKLCLGNSRLIFAVSAAFAAPLLQLLGVESGGIHFRGSSSSGKTTCLKAAASVWGGVEYLLQWRATANGLEGVACAHNDTLLCLDEMGQMDAEEVGQVAYMLANGVGKARAEKTGDARRRKNWNLIFISSGEIGLSDHMATAKQQSRAGQEVRVLDIPADGQAYGCFDDLHGLEHGKNFAEHIGALCKSYYGNAGVMFIESLIASSERVVSESRIFMQDLANKYVPAGSSGEVYRAFNRFALVALAGELASSYEITGWEEGEATRASIRCFQDWLEARGDIGPREEQAVLARVKHFFEQHGESRFTPWNGEDVGLRIKTTQRVGFRKSGDEGDEYYVFSECFKRDIAFGYDASFVAQVCLKNGLLKPDPKGGATRSERLPGTSGNTRVYRFTSKVISDCVEKETLGLNGRGDLCA